MWNIFKSKERKLQEQEQEEQLFKYNLREARLSKLNEEEREIFIREENNKYNFDIIINKVLDKL